MINQLKAIFVLINIVILSACSGLPTKQFVPLPLTELNPEKATIIVKRPHAMIAAWNNPTVFDSWKPIGEISNGGELKWNRDEGIMNMDIWHVTMGTTDGHTFPKSEVYTKLEVEKNKVYTFIYKFGGLIQPSSLRLVGDESSQIKFTSSPSGAQIFSGDHPNNLRPTTMMTPFNFVRQAGTTGWAAERYKMSLAGYEDSPVVYMNNTFGDRIVHFDLKPITQSSSPIFSPVPTPVQAPPPWPSPDPPRATQPTDYSIYTGTGWLTKGGYVVTNHHVVDGEFETVVRFSGIDQEYYDARVVISDKHNDLAILKIENNGKVRAKGIKVASDLPKIGESVFTIGYPKTSVMGKNPKLTNGIVSSLSGLQDDPRIIQTTVAIQSGNSGGPLLNMKGEAVGVTTSQLRPRATKDGLDIPQDVNYAVKSAYVLALLSSLPGNDSYPMVNIAGSKLEDIVPAVQDSIVQILVKSSKQ